MADPARTEALDEVAVLRQLELFGGELACRNATADEIAAIAALSDRVERDHATGDAVEVFDLDMQMHRLIVAAGHNAALARTHGEHLVRLWRIRFLSARRRADAGRVLADHGGMVAALAARDAPAMRRHMERHLDRLVRNVERHFADTRKPAPVGGPAAIP